MSQLLKLRNSVFGLRFLGKKPYNWRDEGIQYDGFKYYPRDKDFKDPPYEASKLFRVQRIKPLPGTNFREKKILLEFGLDGLNQPVAIVKNIPENNHRLWKIKHLIDIKPITFPDGFPEDTKGTYLQENGELRVAKRIGQEARLQLASDYKTATVRMDGDTLRRQMRKRWQNGW